LIVQIEGNETYYYEISNRRVEEAAAELKKVSEIEDLCRLVINTGTPARVHSSSEVDLLLVNDSTCYDETEFKELMEEITG
jgi:hypothetical protein